MRIAHVSAFITAMLMCLGTRGAVAQESELVDIAAGRRVTDALQSLLPNGSESLEVKVAGATVVIRGQVFDVADIERATTIVHSLMGGGKELQIINALTVAGDAQVQLEVAFAEVNRGALRQIGLNFFSRSEDYAGGLLAPGQGFVPVDPQLGPGTNVPPPAAGEAPVFQPSLNAVPLLGVAGAGFGAIFSDAKGEFPFSVALSVLSQRNYSRVLAEPTLVAMSGQEARFLAGGEVPIPIAQPVNAPPAFDYRPFGVQLAFTPIVMSETIQLELDVRVSSILSPGPPPTFGTRQSSTTVRLRDGQSFAIAGLLQDEVKSVVNRVPLLGHIPVLGALFRSTSYQRNETELLVVVTARIVRPLDQRPGLPGEDTVADPSDLELFLLGSIESKQSTPSGPVGFAR